LLILTFRPHCGPGVVSATSINEYQEYFLGNKEGRCERLTTSLLSCANCLEVWEPQPPGTLWASPELHKDCFTVQPKEGCVQYAETHKYRGATSKQSVPPPHCKQYTLC